MKRVPWNAPEVPIASCSQRLRIERERAMPLLQGEQLARVPNDVGIGDATVPTLRGRVGGCRIAPAAEQRPMRFVLQLPLRRPHPPVAVADAAIGNVKGVDHPVADKPVMLLVARCELRIGTVAVERPDKILRQLAADRQVGRIGFKGYRRIVSGEERIGGERLAHESSPRRRRLAPRSGAFALAHSKLVFCKPQSFKFTARLRAWSAYLPERDVTDRASAV